MIFNLHLKLIARYLSGEHEQGMVSAISANPAAAVWAAGQPKPLAGKKVLSKPYDNDYYICTLKHFVADATVRNQNRQNVVLDPSKQNFGTCSHT